MQVSKSENLAGPDTPCYKYDLKWRYLPMVGSG
ncbi:hypothetical protein V1293_003109 [Bradyrhizobium sp. AZCC 1693]